MDKSIADKISVDLEAIQRKKTEVMEEQLRLEKQRQRLEEQERGLAVTLRYYKGETGGHAAPATQVSPVAEVDDFALLTIADAAGRILRARNNEWTTIGQIETALASRGKKTTYNAIDGTLRYSEAFERRKLGKNNQFRLRAL